VDLTNLVGTIGGLFQNFQAAGIAEQGYAMQAQSARIGGEIAAGGALLSAAGYRESAKAVAGSTAFNLGVDNLNTQRQLKAMSRQYQRITSQQIAQTAANGVLITGKSALMLRNEVADTVGRNFLDVKIDASNKRKAAIYESEVKQTQLENQARASEYQAAAERVMAANRAAEAEYQGEISAYSAKRKAFDAVPTIMSQLFQQ